MKRYESSYCTFAVPDDWDAEPPFAFRERGERWDRLAVQILERSLAEMPSAAAYAREQKPILVEIYEEFELLQEGLHFSKEPGEAYFLIFQFVNDDGYPSQGKTIYFTYGPLVLQLAFTGPAGTNQERDRLFDVISNTFCYRQTEFLAGAKKGVLSSEILHTSKTDLVKLWQGTWRKLRRACVALPVPSNWEFAEGRREIVFRRANAEIRLNRELGGNNDVDAWFATRLRHLQISGDLLLGSELGEIENGQYVAVLYEERGIVRTWKTSATNRSLDVFLQGRQPILWTLRAPASNFFDTCQILESLVVVASFLDPTEWETPLNETWIHYIMNGFWEPQGLGVYAEMSGSPLILCVSEKENRSTLTALKPYIADSLAQRIKVSSNPREERLGTWGEHEVFQFSADGTSDGAIPLSLRSLWIQAIDILYGITISGRERDKANALYKSIVGSLVIPGLPASKLIN